MDRSTYEATGGPTRDRSFADVLKDVASSIQDIIRSEMRLAKAETKEELVKVWSAARLLIAGSVLGLYALGFILVGGVQALALTMPFWIAALIGGAVLAIVAGSLVSAGRSRFKHIHPAPEKTIQTVKEIWNG